MTQVDSDQRYLKDASDAANAELDRLRGLVIRTEHNGIHPSGTVKEVTGWLTQMAVKEPPRRDVKTQG